MDSLIDDKPATTEPPIEEVFLIPLPGVEEEFKIMCETDIVTQEPFCDIDNDIEGSIDDDGVSRGSKSNYSEVDENDRASQGRDTKISQNFFFM